MKSLKSLIGYCEKVPLVEVSNSDPLESIRPFHCQHSLASSLILTRMSLALCTLSHCERSLGLQQARRSMALSASLLNPASSSLSSSRAVRWLKSRHSEDWVIFWCIMQRASISLQISFLSTSLWGMVYDRGAGGFQYNSYQRLIKLRRWIE